ncbi:MAG: 4-hydroxy-tetrahydrodipicolinate reductase [Firmicutes bacterium]|nr:4-hydroxy-tetrahydrodipicolinate reductase [Bacillota bacterium]
MKILLTGYGRMGQFVEQIATQRGHEVIGHVDVNNVPDLETLPAADVVIDFSHPSMLDALGAYVKRTGTALVSGTTGYQAEHMAKLQELAGFAPVLHSANYSLGVAMFKYLLQQLPAQLKESFDIEILEKHHNKKVDAPSGTAKMLLDAIDPDHEKKVVTGRDGMCGARTKDEIGVMALRGGTVAGEHTVYLFGEDETLSITHSAASRRIFAVGAVQAAEKMVGKEKGYYLLDQILFS